ncbi:hypothetical protein CEXT_292121 [Caerostris extrusa]|uniref:Uncharacterized protein n=1 Tax=Caerostris extrusa TaxID=172846 RepID=A0AAV4SP81_CAEEX|nr:hypothetical protein CEXT_292121 [Caerostris extrusa]
MSLARNLMIRKKLFPPEGDARLIGENRGISRSNEAGTRSDKLGRKKRYEFHELSRDKQTEGDALLSADSLFKNSSLQLVVSTQNRNNLVNCSHSDSCEGRGQDLLYNSP